MQRPAMGLTACLAILAAGAAAAAVPPTSVEGRLGGVAFLASQASAEQLGPEARAAARLARKLVGAQWIFTCAAGQFVSEDGQPVDLERFRVIWHHQGDSAELTGPLYEERSIESLRRYAGQGGGLFLSGAALALVGPLEVDAAQPRLAGPGKDGYLAQLIPAVEDHPVFEGLSKQGVDLDPRVGGNPRVVTVPITDAGFPAFADFHGSGGPRGGLLLARAAAGGENPLVEYALGRGRVIVMGWRLPHYSHRTNAHRDNLERLTANILTYLGEGRRWRPLHAERVASRASGPRITDDQWRALEMAVSDLIQTFGDRYPRGRDYLEELCRLKEAYRARAAGGDSDALDAAIELQQVVRRFHRLQQEALLANPLLDFDRLLVVERRENRLGLPANWQSNSSLPATGYDNRLAILDPLRPGGQLTTLYRPDGGRFVGDVDLHFDADRLLFSMPGRHGRWQVFEIGIDGSHLRQLPLIDEPDVDNYDACYLPDESIVFTSTATFVGVPCVYGSSHVANLYRLAPDGSIRQLTVDQDHDWCPTVTPTGRVLYLRWEYSDLPHSNSRILFHMNPDGTGQAEYYGSNSFFPNSFFYARPVPGHPTMVVGIATGHHGVKRSGRLLLVDPARGRQEAEGVVQEIPGWGKPVEPVILDALADGCWPQFLHPYPLSEKYFLVSAKPSPSAPWGIYLVDVFDNMVLIKDRPGYALLEPIPIRQTSKPPVVEDRTDPKRKDAVVLMTDVYRGGGLAGIPRGTVRKLRLITYHFSYRGMGGLLGAVGMDGPWDVKRVLGTVPVEADGSAKFRVPAYTPIAVQPLDAEGKALQLMRSWFTAMPGEVLSCVGCHEAQNTATPNLQTMAARRPPSEITPWYGPARGFSFAREVQPVLDRYCVGCHDGSQDSDAGAIDLRGSALITDWTSAISGHVDPSVGGKFSVAYANLHRFVRRPGIESTIRLLVPMEFHADTTELVQLLTKGHHGVRLDRESWDRLVTWIDLNAPYHGTWGEIAGTEAVRPMWKRARQMRLRYTGMDDDPEATAAVARLSAPIEPRLPSPHDSLDTSRPPRPDWPFDPGEARRRQARLGRGEQTVDLGKGVKLQLVRIPPGKFVMGSTDGCADERPPSAVRVEKAFWIGRFEVTNEQFARFDPSHDSRVEPMHGYQFGIRGYPVDKPRQPVVRISWDEAMTFCRWLSQRTGRRFNLPTEAQWEYACRAGSDRHFWYGDLDTDFSPFANVGDATLSQFALDTYIQVKLVPNPNRYDDWVPKDERYDDGGFVSVPVGSYQPNPWGLYDTHGNVWEWTRSLYRPYPYDDRDGRNDPRATGKRVVRGGSWYDRPRRCSAAFRLAYRPYQRVFNVGFRVVLEED
ncbi:MAG TPA: hypothetical protein EYH34_17770 [Planctomycetes bacterium]|nr:hypothetical protein [Planctomycetota bacterium]